MATAKLPGRLLWFIALWAGGVLAVGIVGYGIKVMLNG